MTEYIDPNFDYDPSQGDGGDDGDDGDDGSGTVVATPRSGERMSYTLERNDSGNVVSASYGDGHSIKYTYDDQGNLSGVNDDISGMSFEKDAQGNWWQVAKDGSRTAVDGTISVNQNTGGVQANLNNGYTVTYKPDGSVTVSQPGNISRGDDGDK